MCSVDIRWIHVYVYTITIHGYPHSLNSVDMDTDMDAKFHIDRNSSQSCYFPLNFIIGYSVELIGRKTNLFCSTYRSSTSTGSLYRHSFTRSRVQRHTTSSSGPPRRPLTASSARDCCGVLRGRDCDVPSVESRRMRSAKIC